MTRNTLIAVGLMIVVAAIYVATVFLPGMRSASETLAQLNSKLVCILEAQKMRIINQQIQRDLKNTLSYNDKYGTQILKSSDLPVLYGKISQIAKSHNAAMPKFEPHLPVFYDSVHRMAIGLGISGSFAAIHKIVGELEALPAGIWIDDMQIRGTRENGKSIECDMTLVVFIDNPEKND
jgi:Tfp pilus assembly protein PilO